MPGPRSARYGRSCRPSSLGQGTDALGRTWPASCRAPKQPPLAFSLVRNEEAQRRLTVGRTGRQNFNWLRERNYDPYDRHICFHSCAIAARADTLTLAPKYDVVGTNPNGSKYAGTVTIEVISDTTFT